jgi:predicted dehydrogenase
MNLTPEDKKIGQENFCAAIGSKLTRQAFLKKQIEQGVASGAGLGSYYYKYENSVKEPIRVAVLGTGDEGSVLIGAINPNFVQVKAIADIRPYNVYRAFHGDYYSPAALAVRPGLMAKYGWKSREEAEKNVKIYADYRDLVKEAKSLGIEAVIIALPLHLHAPAAVAAMKAGLHVLTEKLMGHSVHECKEMARVAQQTKLHLATGHQRHYNILYENSVELIRKGVLGDLHYIRAQWHRGNLPGNDSWQQPMPESVKPKDDLAGKLEKELAAWQKKLKELEKDAKKAKEAAEWKVKIDQKIAQIADEKIKELAKTYGYEDKVVKDGGGNVVYNRPAIEELIRWRLWDRTGGGLMAELGSHQLDAASIFIAAAHGGVKQYPLNVMAASNRPLFPADRDVEDHVYCLFEFPAPDYRADDELLRQKKISVAYASINGNGWGGYGETVFGTNGTLILGEERDALLYKTHFTGEHIKLAQKAEQVRKSDGTAEKVEKVVLNTLDASNPNDKFDEQAAAIGNMATVGAVRGYTEQIEHWAWCIRNPAPENLPHCHPKVALGDAVIALTTNMAARRGERMDFKKEWFDPDRDETPENEKPDLSRYA